MIGGFGVDGSRCGGDDGRNMGGEGMDLGEVGWCEVVFV